VTFIAIALTTSEQWSLTESFQFTSVALITVSWNQIYFTLLQNLFTFIFFEIDISFETSLSLLFILVLCTNKWLNLIGLPSDSNSYCY